MWFRVDPAFTDRMQSSVWGLALEVCACVPTVFNLPVAVALLGWSPLLALCRWLRPLKACCQSPRTEMKKLYSFVSRSLSLFIIISVIPLFFTIKILPYSSRSGCVLLLVILVFLCLFHFHLFSFAPLFCASLQPLYNPQSFTRSSSIHPFSPPFPSIQIPVSLICTLLINISLSQWRSRTDSTHMSNISYISHPLPVRWLEILMCPSDVPEWKFIASSAPALFLYLLISVCS